MLKTTGAESFIRLMFTNKSSATQLASNKDIITINGSPTSESKVIKGVDGDGNEIDNVDIIDANRTTKFNNLVKTGVGFFTLGPRLVFIKLR